MISEKEYRYYQRLHQNRLNLVIHIIGSMMFMAGNILMLIGLFNFIDFTQVLIGLSLIITAIVLQELVISLSLNNLMGSRVHSIL